jgi:capsid portal protein
MMTEHNNVSEAENILTDLRDSPNLPDVVMDESAVATLQILEEEDSRKADISIAREADKFREDYRTHDLLEPPFVLEDLINRFEESNILGSVVEAVCTAVYKMGFHVEPKNSTQSEARQVLSRGQENTRVRIRRFFDFINPDLKSWAMVQAMNGTDLEKTGVSFMEYIRDRNGRVRFLNNIDPTHMRLSKLDEEFTVINIEVPSMTNSNRTVTVPYRKRFRRFAQKVRGSDRIFWYKEFGDPRTIDALTGNVVDLDRRLTEPNPKPFIPANEIVYRSIYKTGSPYGIPRWIGTLMTILGIRKAEELNFKRLDKNMIPPMAFMVEGGQWPERVKEAIRRALNSNKGQGNFLAPLFLHASPAEDQMRGPGQGLVAPTIKIQSLVGSQPQDWLFEQHITKGRDMARSQYRLPPIFIGNAMETKDAENDIRLADKMVFAPLRRDNAFIIENTIFQANGWADWRYVPLGPKPESVSDMMSDAAKFIQTGAITPNLALSFLGLIFDKEFEPIAEPWGDLPVSVLSGRGLEAIKLTDAAPGADTSPEGVEQATKSVLNILDGFNHGNRQ